MVVMKAGDAVGSWSVKKRARSVFHRHRPRRHLRQHRRQLNDAYDTVEISTKVSAKADTGVGCRV